MRHLHDPSRSNAGEVIRGHLKLQTSQHWDHRWRRRTSASTIYREGISLLASVPLKNVQEFRLGHGHGISRGTPSSARSRSKASRSACARLM